MQIEIQALGFTLTEALRDHSQRRLRLVFSRFGDHIQRITMRLSDINGPRGGADKRCQVQVVLEHARDALIEDTETDLYVAIDRATDRACRTVERRLSRQRTRGRYRDSRNILMPSVI